MLNKNYIDKVYLACGHTDMRKSIDGLAVLVQEVFLLDPFSPALFVFCNKGKNKLKILHWEHNGFWLYYRRLERGRFQWPINENCETITIGTREFGWLLDGLSLAQKQAHQKVTANILI